MSSHVVLRTAAEVSPRPVREHAAPRPLAATVAVWMRRLHLYSGLAMLPFVLIYAVSALCFNHAGGDAPRVLSVPEPIRERWSVDAPAVAERVAGSLAWQHTETASAHADGEWTFEYRDGGAAWRLSMPLADRPPTVRQLRSAAASSERVPAALFAGEAEAAERAAAALLAANGRDATDLRRVGSPNVRVRSARGEATVSMQRGQVGWPSSGVDVERLLMRLHTTHGFTTGSWARTAWAVIVDLMAAAMLLWTVSGVWMWWQKRSHRRAGGLVLLVGVGAAALCAVALAIQFG
jgi:hypothetical protein